MKLDERDPQALMDSAYNKFEQVAWQERWERAGLSGIEKAAVITGNFAYQISQNGLAGWVGYYDDCPQGKVLQASLAVICQRGQGIDPEIAEVVTAIAYAIDQGEELDRFRFLQFIYWGLAPWAESSFYQKLLASWPEDLDPLQLTPIWPPSLFPGVVRPRNEAKPRYPHVAVGITPAGNHLPIKIEDLEHTGFNGVVGAVLRGLWKGGASAAEMNEFFSQADGDRKRLPETIARWVNYDGIGLESEPDLEWLRGELYPPHPWRNLLSLRNQEDRCIVITESSAFAERLMECRPDASFERIQFDGSEKAREKASLALRRGSEDVFLLSLKDGASEADSNMLMTLVEMGPDVILLGSRSKLLAALQPGLGYLKKHCQVFELD